MDTRNYDRDQDHDDFGRNTDNDRSHDRDRDLNSSNSTTGNRNMDSSFSNQDWQSRWSDIESDYRNRYPSITDDDVDNSDGDFDSMTDRIAKRTNRNYQDVQNEIRNWDSQQSSGDRSGSQNTRNTDSSDRYGNDNNSNYDSSH